jgi:hypothetical protein
MILGFPLVWLGAFIEFARNGFWVTEWKSPLIIYSISLISNAYLWGLVGVRILERKKRKQD